ncbi:kinase-like domain-containing protein [Sparassis latifolia]|uniref:Protein kinase domain-containing protein n=1 Tax=Sparassis crispa TaxID=139825 RepID=A0A401GIC0_9APHY|nr:hypothetical protein SCP_0403300 [Sparassis crispa]GBE81954.1 hypothetical protein SCP_0403300 [Sparassis crispa]
MFKHFDDSDIESASTSSSGSFDEEEANVRVSPSWYAYRHIIESRGYRLDTYHDVKQFYQLYLADSVSEGRALKDMAGYTRACNGGDDNALCNDAGLPEHLFRGTRCADGTKVVLKAVHIYGREYEITRYLSSASIRGHSMNHCIPVLDFIENPTDHVVFIVMEEWSPLWVDEIPCTKDVLLDTLRKCAEHIVFMHAHQIAHLDISMRNILTDGRSHYAWIDYETSRRFDGMTVPRIQHCRASEVPPEIERGECSDPFKVDVWALGVLMLKACELTGNTPPELLVTINSMLHHRFEKRPTAKEILRFLEAMVARIGDKKRRDT